MKLDSKIKELKQAICQGRGKEICTTVSAALNGPTLVNFTNSNSVRATIKMRQKTDRKTVKSSTQHSSSHTKASFRFYQLSLSYSFHLLSSSLNTIICVLISYMQVQHNSIIFSSLSVCLCCNCLWKLEESNEESSWGWILGTPGTLLEVLAHQKN